MHSSDSTKHQEGPDDGPTNVQSDVHVQPLQVVSYAGATVGEDVGVDVGLEVGERVGAGVGLGVGDGVGAGVGAAVGHTSCSVTWQ